MKKLLSVCFFYFTTFSFYGQVPVISYSTPNIFFVNQVITPLLPTNEGGAIPNEPIVSTLAGSGSIGVQDSIGADATFNFPTVVTLNHQGNILVVDRSNHKIRSITLEGVVTTLAGTGIAGAADGSASTASFRYPDGAVTDSQGAIFVTDQSNHTIRKITTNGMVSTFAGSTAGFSDGLGTAAKFYYPAAMTIDGQDNLYVADWNNHKIRKVTPEGLVTTYAGTSAGFADGIAATAKFNGPTGLGIDGSGNLYVADYGNHRIRKITVLGQVSTVAGNGTAGFLNGTATEAIFNHPAVVAVAYDNALFVTDEGNNKIRKISPQGEVSTFAGSGSTGTTDGAANTASFNNPTGIAVGQDNKLYIADYANHKIRKIDTYGYAISPSLPAGLNFNKVSGVITGEPLEVSPMTNYTVTAENQSGSSTFVVAIEVHPNLNASTFSENGLKVYPNPVKDKLTISNTQEITEVIVYTALGQPLQKIKRGALKHIIDLSDYETGSYICKIVSGSESKEIKILKK